jgi:hypothetical protein
LWPPNQEEVEQLLQFGESCGFPGMLGSINHMYCQRENCPLAWKGGFTRGDKGVPTMILEVVASHNLRIWLAFLELQDQTCNIPPSNPCNCMLVMM